MREKVYSAFILLLIIGLGLSYAIPAWLQRDNADDAPNNSTNDADSGVAIDDDVDFAYGESRTWDDDSNVARLAAQQALENLGYSVTARDKWLEHADSGFLLRPKLLDYETLDDGRIQTVTAILTVHPELIPAGVFEYQHSTGDSLENSVREGYELWAQIDLVVLLDALREMPKECAILNLHFPAKEGAAALRRRIVLGPVQRMTAKGSAGLDGDAEEEEEAEAEDEKHDAFCSCCFLMQNFDAFKSLVESDRFCGIRFYAMRDASGEPIADCRVNGEDYEEGAAALREYVQKWPERGVEARKQYVVLHTVEASDTAPPEEPQDDHSAPTTPENDASESGDGEESSS